MKKVRTKKHKTTGIAIHRELLKPLVKTAEQYEITVLEAGSRAVEKYTGAKRRAA